MKTQTRKRESDTPSNEVLDFIHPPDAKSLITPQRLVETEEKHQRRASRLTNGLALATAIIAALYMGGDITGGYVDGYNTLLVTGFLLTGASLFLSNSMKRHWGILIGILAVLTYPFSPFDYAGARLVGWITATLFNYPIDFITAWIFMLGIIAVGFLASEFWKRSEGPDAVS